MQIRNQKGGLFTAQQTTTSTPAYRSERMFSSAGAALLNISFCLPKENKQTQKGT